MQPGKFAQLKIFCLDLSRLEHLTSSDIGRITGIQQQAHSDQSYCSCVTGSGLRIKINACLIALLDSCVTFYDHEVKIIVILINQF